MLLLYLLPTLQHSDPDSSCKMEVTTSPDTQDQGCPLPPVTWHLFSELRPPSQAQPLSPACFTPGTHATRSPSNANPQCYIRLTCEESYTKALTLKACWMVEPDHEETDISMGNRPFMDGTWLKEWSEVCL